MWSMQGRHSLSYSHIQTRLAANNREMYGRTYGLQEAHSVANTGNPRSLAKRPRLALNP